MKPILALPVLLLALACDHDVPPVAPTGPLVQAEALIAKRDYPAAITLLEDLRKAQGDEPAVMERLVKLYEAQGDSARAIQRARAGLDAHPDAKPLYPLLARLYIEVGQLALAKPLLLEARKVGVDDKEVSLALGSCLGRMGDTAGARAEFERARAAGAEEQVVQFNLGLVFVQEHETAQALAVFEDLVKKYPALSSAKRELARLLLEQATAASKGSGVLDRAPVNRAMDLLWSIKDQLKNDWRVHEAMGDGWLLVGDFEASIAAYTEALKLGQNPKSVEDRYRVAKMKQKEAAEKAAQTTDKEAPVPK